LILSIAEAKPLVIPTPLKIDDSQIVTVLANDKLLLILILGQAGHLVWFLVKSIWSSKNKQFDEMQRNMKLLPDVLAKLEHIDKRLTFVPTFEQTELMILKHDRDMKKKAREQ
jgi:hypothetical protein